MSVPDGSEPTQSLSHPVLPVGLLGMLAIVLAVEIGFCRFDRRWTSLGAGNWRQTGVDARTQAVGVDVLFFGDSLVKTGLAPVILEERIGLTAYNLASLGAPPSASYFLFRRALESGARPRAVVLDAQPAILMLNDPFVSVREWSELIGPSEMLELARVEHNPHILAPLLMNRYWPSIRYRHDIRKTVCDLFRTPPTEFSVTWFDLNNRQLTINRGCNIYPGIPNHSATDQRPNGDVKSEEVLLCYPEMWWARPANLVFLEKFFSMAESRGIPVFFLLPPIHPLVQRRRDRLGLEDRYIAIIQKIQRRFRSVIVIDGRYSGFDAGLYWDPFHLGREGAMALSRGVADVIGSWLVGKIDTSRWITLPKFAEPPPQLAIEDMGETRARLGGSATIRR